MIVNKKDTVLIKRATKYIKPYKIRFSLAFLLILLGIIIEIIQVQLWATLVVTLFDKDFTKVVTNIFLIVLVFILSALLDFAKSYLTSSLSQLIIFDLKKDIFDKILNLPIKAFDEMRTGDFLSRLQGDVDDIADIISNHLLNTTVEIFRALVIGIVLFRINVYMALVVLIGFPVMYIIYHKFGIKIRRENEKFCKFNDSYFSHIQQTIAGIREIKSFGAKKIAFKSFLDLSTKLKLKSIKMVVLNSFAQLISQIVSFSSEIIVMFVGGYFVYKNILSMKNFIAFNSYSSQFSNSLMSITRINSNIQKVLTSLERIFELMDNLNYEIEENGSKRLDNLVGNIVFKNVSFQYTNKIELLHNINLSIPANKKIAFVGQSGSGKTTLFNLLLRFYKPLTGEITIDGIKLSEIDEDSLRKNISIVHQEPYFLATSIKENLKLANPQATDLEIKTACKAAYIHDYIESLKDNYDTILGENGITLSGGQKQRLAIARVLLKKSKIILFDEATSALDNESQIKIKNAIDKISKNHTILIIAHRLITVLEANEIIVISEGKITGQGSHDYLIKNNLIYKRLYEMEINTLKLAP